MPAGSDANSFVGRSMRCMGLRFPGFPGSLHMIRSLVNGFALIAFALVPWAPFGLP